MAERVEKVTREVTPETTDVRQREVHEVSEATVSGSTLAARVVWYVTAVLLTLLAFRFILAALGANPNNGFADFIYDVSHPFVAPFFGLFNYDLLYGVSRFEIYTLVAMAVYTVVGYGLARLMTIGHTSHPSHA